MTWAEFQIKAFAYNRMQDREDLRAREIAWASLVAPHINPKKLPKNKERFWSIGKKTSNVTESMMDAMRKAKEQYEIDKKLKENGE